MDYDTFDFNTIRDDLVIMQSYIDNLPNIGSNCQYEIEMRYSGEIVNRYNVQQIISTFENWEECEFSEERYEHLTNNKIKIRTRTYGNHVETTSKSQVYVNKYSNHWMKLCLSMESIGDFQPFGTIKTLQSHHVRQYIKRVTDDVIIDIKLYDNKIYPSIEVELSDLQDIDIFVSTCRTIRDILVGPTYMSHRIYNAYMLLMKNMCDTINIFTNNYPKPITLQRFDDIREYFVTSKTDGERCWLLGTQDNSVLEINTQGRMIMLDKHQLKLRSKFFLIDCEKVQNTYTLLDILFLNTTPVHTLSFEKRMKMFDIVANKLGINTKKYSHVTGLHAVSKYWDKVRHTAQDGLIFIKNDKYYPSRIYKWKYNNTVDLLVRDNTLVTSDGRQVLGYAVDFSNLRNNCIYEFGLKNNTLYHIRERMDKKYPNKYDVVLSNLQKALNFSILEMSCRNMYLYHRKIEKSVLRIMKQYGKRLLDIGSTQYIPSWREFDQVYCTRYSGDGITILDTNIHMYDIITIFFRINSFDDDDFDELESMLGGRPVAIIFMDGELVESYKCNSYEICIHENVVELMINNVSTSFRNITRHNLIEYMKRQQYIISLDFILNRAKLSPDELRLSGCYRVMIFTK